MRADVSMWSTASTPTAVYAPASSAHIAMSGHGVPPMAASRMAFMPQVGGRIHEIGRTQSGRSESGTRNPAISQTGNSSMLPSAQPAR